LPQYTSLNSAPTYPGIVSNLLKNNNAQEGLKHWDIIQNGGEGFGSGFYNNSVNKGFNTSYEWSIKEQTIDVSKFGALLDETDKVLVGAEFRDVYYFSVTNNNAISTGPPLTIFATISISNVTHRFPSWNVNNFRDFFC
jgi:hypothetical protein